jgi:hypothetical protein
MDATTAAALQEILRRESLSLLSYVGDAYPWTARGGDAALARLRQVVADHKRALVALGRFATRHRVALSYLGSYPSSFTTANFLALDHLLPRLIDSERSSLEQLQAETELAADGEARTVLEQFLAAKRSQLARLELLASPSPASARTPAAS